MIEIVLLSSRQAAAHQNDIAEVYRGAFGMPPYHENEVDVERFERSFLRHVERRDFRCFVAREGEQVLGFAYGYPGEPGGWWREAVAGALSPAMMQTWLDDYFEFAELAVSPSAQGRHLGSQLHDALLQGLSQRTAALSAYQGDTAAMRLYRRRGWVPLIGDFKFPGNSMRFVIMGLHLAADSRSAGRGGAQKKNNAKGAKGA